MDKESMSNYGWIVIVVLVLVAMLALVPVFTGWVESGLNNTFDIFDGEIEEALTEPVVEEPSEVAPDATNP